MYLTVGTSESPDHDPQWQRNYLALLAYERQEGHCNVPRGASYSCTLPDGSRYEGNLGWWLNNQRSRKGTLEPDRRAKLQQLVDKG